MNNKFGGKAAGLKILEQMKVPVPKWLPLAYSQAKDPSNDIINEIISTFGSGAMMAVRSSAANEDGEAKSFAGVFESKLNIPAEQKSLVEAIKSVVASGNADRAIGYDSQENQMGIVIQKMVNPVISGVAFTRAVDTDGQDIILIEAVNGLADKLVSGLVTPTQIKIPVKNGILDNKNISISGSLLNRIDKINLLIPYIQTISDKSKQDLDLEWCIDAGDNVWFVQARPITVPVFIKNKSKSSAIPVVVGTVSAPAFVISELGYANHPDVMEKRFSEFPDGAILIAKYTEANFVPIMKRASGIITEQGGILSHAAILARELGIPCIVNYPNATDTFKTGDKIVMNGSTGEINGDTGNGQIDESTWIDEAWTFDDMIRIPYNDGYIFLEPLPNRLNVHAPAVDSNAAELEMFVRKKFGVVPNIMRDWFKFGGWSENEFRKKLPRYAKSLEYANRVAASGSARQVHKLYNDCLQTVKKYIPLAMGAKNDAVKFYYNEIIMGQYVLLDVIFPRAIALRKIYFDTAHTLYNAGATFADLLGGKKIKGISKKYHEFIKAIADERNEIYETFEKLYPVIASYWMPDTQDNMMNAALDAIGVPKENRIYLYKMFFDNLSKVKSIL
ncbi:MAG: hypothetical protein LBF37_00040 [Rickettsiales bacterium]|jgi:phosphohistidine swiveling domain-containing protein|nr:hypothetical protein [Rickettsiales bacterium]